MTVLEMLMLHKSYIRKGKYRPATPTAAAAPPAVSRSGDLPWILKRVGLETFGQRLKSSISKTKRIAVFFPAKKNIFKIFHFF